MRPPASASPPSFDGHEEPSCSSSSPASSALRLRPRAASPALGDLASRLEGWDHPDDRVAPDGARLRATKYARGWRPSRGDFRSERGPARPNVQVPFASEPSALREFLWGLIHGFGDLASIVKGAVTCDRTVLDKLPYRSRGGEEPGTPKATAFGFSPRPGGAVDPEKLERVLDAQARGLFSSSRGEKEEGRPRPSSSSERQQQGPSSSSFWARRRLPSLLLPPSSAAVSTWSLPEEAEAEAQRHRLAPRGSRKESAGKGLALLAALNVALLYAGSRAPTG